MIYSGKRKAPAIRRAPGIRHRRGNDRRALIGVDQPVRPRRECRNGWRARRPASETGRRPRAAASAPSISRRCRRAASISRSGARRAAPSPAGRRPESSGSTPQSSRQTPRTRPRQSQPTPRGCPDGDRASPDRPAPHRAPPRVGRRAFRPGEIAAVLMAPPASRHDAVALGDGQRRVAARHMRKAAKIDAVGERSRGRLRSACRSPASRSNRSPATSRASIASARNSVTVPAPPAAAETMSAASPAAPPVEHRQPPGRNSAGVCAERPSTVSIDAPSPPR